MRDGVKGEAPKNEEGGQSTKQGGPNKGIQGEISTLDIPIHPSRLSSRAEYLKETYQFIQYRGNH